MNHPLARPGYFWAFNYLTGERREIRDGTSVPDGFSVRPMMMMMDIGEGIETAASAGKLLQLPAWAAISAGNLARGLVLPQEVTSIVIAADSDEAGQDAARSAWSRWTSEGRTVRIATPDRHGADFNDILLEAGRG